LAKKAGQAAVSKTIFTEGRKGNEATGVGPHQISKQALLLPPITEKPTALRYLGYLLFKQIGIDGL
jgi:hypothetical protein